MPHTTDHPRCNLCRNRTFATLSLQTHPDPEWKWSHYCDPCGVSMASVIRDSQKRDPEIRRLPDPPAAEPEPVKESTKKKKVEPVVPVPVVPEPAKERPRRVVPPPPKDTGGNDLLALLGLR